MQHLPPYALYKAGTLDWSKHWAHCREADIDALFPETPMSPASPASLKARNKMKRSDWDGTEQRKMDKRVTDQTKK